MKDLPATRRTLGVSLAAVLLAGAVSYARATADGFVMDDAAAITQHRGVTDPTPHDLLARDFWGGTRRHPRAVAYRPLTTASFALDWRLGHGAPSLFHLSNVVLHLVVSGLVLFALWSLDGMRRRAALAAALLFAVHPIHAEAVAGLVGRADVLSALFVLIAWWLHRRPEGWATPAAPLALLCGLLAKESALVLLPLLVVVELRRDSPADFGARLLRWVGYAGAVALALWLRQQALGSWHAPPATSANPLVHATGYSRRLTALALFAHALDLQLLPFDLLPDYGRAVVVPLEHVDTTVAIGAALILALVALALFQWSRPGPLVDAVAFLVLPGLLAVNAIWPLPVAFAERWWYLPSLGGCVLVALLLDLLAERTRALVPLGVLGLVVAGFALVTFRRTIEWRDGESLFTSCVATDPRSALCQYSLGAIRDGQERDDEALTLYQRAEALDPGWSEPHAAAAAILARQGRVAEAQAAFDKMRAAGNVSAIGRLNYARFLLHTGRLGDGQRELDSLHEGKSDEP